MGKVSLALLLLLVESLMSMEGGKEGKVIKCYQCSSSVSCGRDDEFCVDEVCFKKRIPDGKGSTKYEKGCTKAGTLRMGCQEMDASGTTLHCYCDDQAQFCNAGPAKSLSVALFALSCALLFLLNRPA